MIKNKVLTEEILREYCKQGITDKAIGIIYGMTGEGIAYRRKKFKIALKDKYNSKKEEINKFKATSIEILSSDYYSMNQLDFKSKYKVSKTISLPLLRRKGIIGKKEHRINSYLPLTPDQRTMIIGSLLGDGSVSRGNYFYESHSKKQSQYLYLKHEILKPFSGPIYPVDKDTGLRFKTVEHPVFNEFYKEFYKIGIKGKQIPVTFLEQNWEDKILVYWFLDDGHFNDESNELFIANKAPIDQLVLFLEFLEDKYHWEFRYSKV